MSNTAHSTMHLTNGSNSVARDELRRELMNEVREYGRNSAEGKDSLPMLATRVIKASADGIIDLSKDANGWDDAAKMYEAYVTAESKKAVHDHTDTGKKANVSKLRQLVIFGALTTVDPVDVHNRTFEKRLKMAKEGQNVKAAYPAYVDVARAQIKTQTELSDDELTAVLLKPEKNDPDVVTEITQIKKRIERLITGEKGLQDNSEQIIQVNKLLGERLAALTLAAETTNALSEYEVLKAKLAKLGISADAPAAVNEEVDA